MIHIFIKPHQISENIIQVYDNDFHHLKDVLRVRPGEELSFAVEGESSTEYRGRLTGYGPDHALCELLFKKEADVELPCRITLYQGLPKGDKMETVIQKAVELGAANIVPVAMERSVVKLDDKKAAKKQARWQEIAKNAAMQSQRAIIPKVYAPMSFKEAIQSAQKNIPGYTLKEAQKNALNDPQENDAINSIAANTHIFMPYENAEGMEGTRDLLKQVSAGDSISVFIGPEGGISVGELELAREAGAHIISLGRRILRTETAGMTFLSFLVYLLEK